MMSKGVFAALLIALFFGGCYQKSGLQKPKQLLKNPKPITDRVEIRDAIIASIDKRIGSSTGGDCSGFVSVINKEHNSVYFNEDELGRFYTNSSKSNAIYNLYRSKKRLYTNGDPAASDLIFFSDTIDKTQSNSGEVTHIGIIYGVDEDGTVAFANLLGEEIKISFMNLSNPKMHALNGYEINSFLKKCPQIEAHHHCLAPIFFRGYGSIRE